MGEFCMKPELALALLDEIGRHRALEPHETDLLEDVIAMMNPDAQPFKWNPMLEAQLMVASASPGAIVRFARRHGIDNVNICYAKLHRLRQCKARKDARAMVKG